jgi:nucleotide-binding universal stress UspA family protein
MLDVQPLEFVSNDVARDICRTADAVSAAVVLIGAHRPLLLEGTLGGTVGQVVTQAKGAVGVFVDRGLRRIENVMVASFGDVEQTKQLVGRLAKAPGVRLTVMGTKIDLTGQASGGEGIRTLTVAPELLAEVTVQEAGRGYDLVVVSVNGELSAFDDSCQRIVANSSASVLVFHHSPLSQVADEPVAHLGQNFAQSMS